MTINAASRSLSITASVDGNLYSKYPDGDFPTVVASLAAAGWGQEITASGTITGPVPLAVHFDATGTAHPSANIWREIGYHWDFGYATPSTPGTWTHSSQNKGNEVGRRPIAAHVYVTAGTYTASVRAQDSGALTSDKSVTIVAVDADTYWTTGGRSTVHIATGDSMPTWADNTRYTFDRGVDYSGKSVTAINSRLNICLAATGSGAKPIMPALTLEAGDTFVTRTWSQSVTFDNLDMTAGFTQGLPCSHVLMHQCDTRSITWGADINWRWTESPSATEPSGWYRPHHIMSHESTHDANNVAASYAMSGLVRNLAVLGSTLTKSTYHNIRLFGFYKVFFAHNSCVDGTTGYANTTFRSQGTNTDYTAWTSSVAYGHASRYLIAAYNAIGSAADTSSDAAMTIQPQSDSEAEGIEDVIIDANAHSRAGGGALTLVCRRALEDDNTFASYSVDTTQGSALTPAEWFGPYYTDNVVANGSTIFAATARIAPSKAGS